MQFTTHTGETITGERLKLALNAVADCWVELARAIREEDAYAPHVTDSVKDHEMNRMIEQAERIRQGVEPTGFWLWQRINTELTGECIAFLSR